MARIFPLVDFPESGWLTREEMIEVDRIMMEDLGISLRKMMEHAGRHLATVVRLKRNELGVRPQVRSSVVVLVGAGGNGGGGLVAARRLHSWGIPVEIVMAREPEEHQGVVAEQLASAQTLGISVSTDVPTSPEIIVDALVGYSLKGPLAGRIAELADWANASSAPVISLDLPTGLDATSGGVDPHAIKATATITLALPKIGLAPHRRSGPVGDLYLADISVPWPTPSEEKRTSGQTLGSFFWAEKNGEKLVNPFQNDDLVQIW